MVESIRPPALMTMKICSSFKRFRVMQRYLFKLNTFNLPDGALYGTVTEVADEIS